jgi:hypothetical protein
MADSIADEVEEATEVACDPAGKAGVANCYIGLNTAACLRVQLGTRHLTHTRPPRHLVVPGRPGGCSPPLVREMPSSRRTRLRGLAVSR